MVKPTMTKEVKTEIFAGVSMLHNTNAYGVGLVGYEFSGSRRY